MSGSQRMFTVAVAVAALALSACREETPESHMQHGGVYATELLRLAAADRAERLDSDAESAGPTRAASLRRADSARTAQLERLVESHGWPTTAAVGAAAVEAFFVLVQHSPSRAFQARARPHLTHLAGEGEISRPDFAMFVDRFLVDGGEPQRYATQFRVRADTLRPEPVQNLAELVTLRREAGLPPMEHYVEALRKAYRLPVAWPPEKETESVAR